MFSLPLPHGYSAIKLSPIRYNNTSTPVTEEAVTMFMKIILLLICFSGFASGAATLLPEDEVDALKDISKTLGKKDWDFTVDPCSGSSGWITGGNNRVGCDCTSLNGTVCHVVSITLKEQSLPGTLPKELVRLPYLQDIDLTRNYLNGTIPLEWGSMKLENIILLTNRISGTIPEELGNITTLKTLHIGFNRMWGNIPPELGKLTQLEKLHLASNNFTGQIPASFAGLTKMLHFRISDNLLSGTIPNFILEWKSLTIVAIQGSGLSGPIPAGLSVLKNLNDLRISDLSGSDSGFPQLNNLTNLDTLIFRSCNIVGSLPDYLGEMSSLKILDLSFNKLSGKIPTSFSQSKVEYLYLTGNLLSGPIPDWMVRNEHSIDLSYNNLSIDRLGRLACDQQRVNLFASSSNNNNSGIIPCLSSCTKRYSFHINCGGKEVTVNGSKIYDRDDDSGGEAKLFLSGGDTKWAFSNTGNFMDDERQVKSYIWQNKSRLSVVDPELYSSARISPISLTYYGYCLGNGNYTVNLHFAEIMFTDDRNYSSLGRRKFDVYIQGMRVEKDFDIAAEAGGVGKAVVKSYTAVIHSNDLEIRFYWAGKGTASVPDRGVYGPLISAISVDPDFTPPLEKRNQIQVGAVVAIVVSAVIVIIMLLGVYWWRCSTRNKSTLGLDLKGLDLQTVSFTLQQIVAATNNFDIANKIGEGGFGPVYKGFLSDGTIIAVKQLSSKSNQGNREFINEIGMISAFQHPHLVKLYGCCVEGDQLLLVYEYMENNSLARSLFGLEKSQLEPGWSTRQKICIGIAKGLSFLHEESRLKIIHRDIKATNVLLDQDLNPKISDFGLAKLHDGDRTHMITNKIAGTYGYMAPEYAMHGYLTKKVDVYSFGIVALEIISGRINTTHQDTQRSDQEFFYLRDWAHQLKDQGNLMELVDPRLGEDFNQEEVMVMINVALLCTSNSPRARPTMSAVVSMLEGKPVVEEPNSDESEIMEETNLEAMRNKHIQEAENNIDETHNQCCFLNQGPHTSPSKSFSDLYPVNLSSYYRKIKG